MAWPAWRGELGHGPGLSSHLHPLFNRKNKCLPDGILTKIKTYYSLGPYNEPYILKIYILTDCHKKFLPNFSTLTFTRFVMRGTRFLSSSSCENKSIESHELFSFSYLAIDKTDPTIIDLHTDHFSNIVRKFGQEVIGILNSSL